MREYSTTTLAEAPNSADHVIVLEQAMVGAPAESKLATLLVEDESEILNLQDNNWGLARVLETAHGTEVPIFGVDVFGRASIEGESTIGTFEVDGVVDFLDTSAPSTVDNFNNSGGTVNVNGGADVTVFNKSELHDLNVIGNDAVLLFKDTDDASGVTHVDNLLVAGGGLVTVQARNQSPTSTSARKLTVNTVAVSADSPSGTLDLTDNLLFVEYSGGSPLTDIQGAISGAYNGGAWTGLGISSSTAAGTVNDDHKTAVGFAEATDLFTSFPATFEGRSIDNTTIIVKYTWYGECQSQRARESCGLQSSGGELGSVVTPLGAWRFQF